MIAEPDVRVEVRDKGGEFILGRKTFGWLISLSFLFIFNGVEDHEEKLLKTDSLFLFFTHHNLNQ